MLIKQNDTSEVLVQCSVVFHPPKKLWSRESSCASCLSSRMTLVKGQVQCTVVFHSPISFDQEKMAASCLSSRMTLVKRLMMQIEDLMKIFFGMWGGMSPVHTSWMIWQEWIWRYIFNVTGKNEYWSSANPYVSCTSNLQVVFECTCTRKTAKKRQLCVCAWQDLWFISIHRLVLTGATNQTLNVTPDSKIVNNVNSGCSLFHYSFTVSVKCQRWIRWCLQVVSVTSSG